MILEHVVLDVAPEQSAVFLEAFRQASPIIAATDGYIRHQLNNCVETPGRFLLLVEWENLDAHMVNFRQSAAFEQWRAALHHFYVNKPVVEHFELAYTHISPME